MSINVVSLTKLYGPQKAVDNISFSVKEGEIVGFLGPNGAGKSTTMKIITGYIPPTAGTVTVDGDDVAAHPIKVKSKIGYLPEHNPLYHDMYVHEYLHFMAGIHGLSTAIKKQRVDEMVRLCGLTAEQNKKIGLLSKGYRQRVGLAQALIHNPKVLILDEPTSGLDPNQLVEIRSLIKAVSKSKTVLFSTHILQEVQALCDRVVVINEGKIVADDTLTSLLQGGGHSLIVEFAVEVSVSDLMSVSGIVDVKKISASRFRIKAGPGDDIRTRIVNFAVEKNLSLIEMRQEDTSLEAVFNQLTTSTDKEQVS